LNKIPQKELNTYPKKLREYIKKLPRNSTQGFYLFNILDEKDIDLDKDIENDKVFVKIKGLKKY